MLLPSKELRELSKRVDICLSGKKSPRGCDIRYRQFYWLMVFNAEGELASAFQLSKELTWRKKLGVSLPVALVAAVESGLKSASSLEALERRYISERGSKASYLALRKKVDEMDGVGQMRVAEFLASAAPKTDDPGLSRVRGIHVAAAACNKQVINHGAFAALRRSIESFILEHPTHPACRDLIEPLANTALKYTFDFSSKCDGYAREWRSRKKGSEKARKSLSALADQILAFRDAEVVRMRKRLSEMKAKEYGVRRIRARLGDAEKILAQLESQRAGGVMKPIYAEWRREASAKLRE